MEVVGSLPLAGMAEGSLPPAGHRRLELDELRVIERECHPWQSVDPRQHLGEHLRIEAPVLLLREVEQPVGSVARDDRQEIGEVASLGASEQREELVHGELFSGKQRKAEPLLDWEQPGIAAESSSVPSWPSSTCRRANPG